MVTSIRRIIRQTSTCLAILLTSLPLARSLGVPLVPQQQQQRHQPRSVSGLAGDWTGAKAALRNPDCCVVSVPGLESHLRVLQAQLADQGPAELDLRARVRAFSSSSSAHGDCLRVRRSIHKGDDENHEDDEDPCTAALVELAQGFASLADGPLEGVCEDVFVRIVCASDYRGRDPMYHTDKAPLRGYVTLRGVGTEFMTRPCSPLEYVTLRGLGKGDPVKSVRRAEELEFIVMKGDHYEYAGYESPSVSDSTVPSTAAAAADSWLARAWKRTAACVHRSSLAATNPKDEMSTSL
jgi:hypothetical protein